MVLDGAIYYYERNSQNDIVGLVDSNMNEVVTYTYDSWGKLLSIGGTLANTVGEENPYRYRGYRYDTETGLYYLQSRYYDPETGRYLNADGAVSTGTGLLGLNMFAYSNNNPVNMHDDGGTRAVENDGGNTGSWVYVADNGKVFSGGGFSAHTPTPSSSSSSSSKSPIKTKPNKGVSFSSNNANIDLDGDDAPKGWPNQQITAFNYKDKTSLSAYSVPYIVVPGSSKYTKYVGCVVLMWDNNANVGYYGVVGDVGPKNKCGEVSICMAEKFNPNQGTNYSLAGSFSYFIAPGTDLRKVANSGNINDLINSTGNSYFGY